jgi:cyclin B
MVFNDGPAQATRARAALSDISNKNGVVRPGGKAGQAGFKQADAKAQYAAKLRPNLLSAFEEAAPSNAPKEPVDKVDMADINDAQAVVPYLQEIHRHYREAEGINLASSTFMSKQEDINEKMRAILIDWLVEVHLKFKLMPETLYLTVNLIDRYLEKEKIKRSQLQLVGVTAMFVASKYEEIYAPECRDFVYISDKAYTREQILKMEGDMLSKLNFQLTTPNALVFLKRFAKVAGVLANPRTKTELLANYLVELTLQDYKMLKYLPSTIAAASTYLALKTMGQQPWTSELMQHACYTEAAIMPCVRDINTLHKNAAANNLQAVRKKYAQEKHGSVSGIPPASF